MNALQQLIFDYLADNPGESYASIARRGATPAHPFPRQTVHSIATKPTLKQTNQPTTLEALARGMDMSLDIVKRAAAEAAGYKTSVSTQADTKSGRIIVEARETLDPERLEVLARRARSLLAEMQEEKESR